jgi:diguanylate cyclase (GGDEF)-like protein
MSAASINAAPKIRRVSRRDLAENRQVWLTTGLMYVVFAVVAVAMLIGSDDIDSRRLFAFLLVALLCAVTLIHGEPPPMESRRNHAVIASVYVNAGIALYAFQPEPTIAMGIAMFIGPLTSVRLQSRRAILGHLAVATSGLAAVGTLGAFTGTLNQATVIGTILVILATWAVGTSCMMALEAAEAQGDELERLVRRDPLTGVGNRRLLLETLEDELPRHLRSGFPLSLIALDLNGFKALNDQLGHPAGDELLRIVAQALVESTSDRDVVIRQGGDEFCVILPETSPATAQRTANAIRAGLATIRFEGQSVASGFGIASFPHDADRADVLLHVADQRLNDAKHSPRRSSVPTRLHTQ